MPDTTDALLTERGNTHGDWRVQSYLTNQIKTLMRSSQSWEDLAPYESEALDMIANKLGRILAGNPHFEDHWADIAGYARLAANSLKP